MQKKILVGRPVVFNDYIILNNTVILKIVHKDQTTSSVIIDLIDLPKIKKGRWAINSRGYVTSKPYRKLLHHVILDMTPSFPTFVVDHINGNKLDNRRGNLRVVSQQINCSNRRKQHNNKSGIVGVHWSQKKQRWIAQISINNRTQHLGNFIKKEEAIKARREAECRKKLL